MRTIDTKFKSSLSLENLVCTHLSVDRSLEIQTDEPLKMQVQRHILFSNESRKAEVTLELTVFSENNDFNACVKMIGYFKIGEGLADNIQQEIIEKNTVSIMFPYLRSQISLITVQPDMVPIVIPPININAMLENSGQDQ